MTRVSIVAVALIVAFFSVLATYTTAQDANTQERTFLTFSAPAEMPGVTLPAGTYVFKLADTPSRNVVQVWSREEDKILGQWTFVQAERPEITQDNVVMFKETAAGQTPAIQYWYYPGEKIGKEFIYPKNQAERIASRTRQAVLSGDGKIEPGSQPAPASASARPVAPAPEAEVGRTPEPRFETRQAEAAPAPPAPRTPERVLAQADTSAAQADTRNRSELPQTASPLALIGALGALSLAGAGALRFVRR